MTVRELRKVLFDLEDQEAIIDMAGDEEGNSFGEISDCLAEGKLKDGKKVYTLYPETNELGEDRYEN